MADPPFTGFALVQDAALILAVDDHCVPLLGSWVHLNAERAASLGAAQASMRLVSVRDLSRATPPLHAPTLRIGNVDAWIQEETETAFMLGATGGCGTLDLLGCRADLQVPHAVHDDVAADLQSMLTISSALLLGRIGRILLHAGAVVTEEGRAWLVVGDARSGKSTTCLSLATSGWGLLSDDQVVLHASAGRLAAEGWLRPPHLDDGWEERTPTGTRRTVQPSAMAVGLPQGPVDVAGTLHTSVAADQSTSVSAISASEAFVGLVRQSPWLLADRTVAPRVVDVLSTLSRLPRSAVRLGLDTFGRPVALREVLAPAVTASGISRSGTT
jgi:hypothetical protein